MALQLRPSTAHASDMGLVVPVLFIPVNVLAGLVAIGLGAAARIGKLGRGAEVVLWTLTWPIGIVAALLALVAFGYLAKGEETGFAGLCLASFALYAASCAFANVSWRRAQRVHPRPVATRRASVLVSAYFAAIGFAVVAVVMWRVRLFDDGLGLVRALMVLTLAVTGTGAAIAAVANHRRARASEREPPSGEGEA